MLLLLVQIFADETYISLILKSITKLLSTLSSTPRIFHFRSRFLTTRKSNRTQITLSSFLFYHSSFLSRYLKRFPSIPTLEKSPLRANLHTPALHLTPLSPYIRSIVFFNQRRGASAGINKSNQNQITPSHSSFILYVSTRALALPLYRTFLLRPHILLFSTSNSPARAFSRPPRVSYDGTYTHTHTHASFIRRESARKMDLRTGRAGAPR